MAGLPAHYPGVPRPGEVLEGKYRVEQVLGAGGMGVVLAAWHLDLERRVAVKFLLPEAMQQPDAVPRFLREAKAAASLADEHVARVLDVGTLRNGAPYMVMEHLTGVDLDALIKQRGPIPLREAVDILLQACEAMAEAHARGIIHRDLKPKNLFITRRPDGRPLLKVLDFGLSKILADTADDTSLTATCVIMGSVPYMAPEQLRSLKHADARTDIWALGIILYQMIAGRRPFEGQGVPAISIAIMADAPAPLCRARPDLPAPLDAVLARCLAKSPAERFQSVSELARALAPFGSSQAMHSLETISRLQPAAVPSAFGARPPSAPPPSRFPPGGVRASPGASAVAIAIQGVEPALLTPHTSWGQTKQVRPPRAITVLLAGVGVGALGALVVAWVLLTRTPAEQPAPPSAAVPAKEAAPAPQPAGMPSIEPVGPAPAVGADDAASRPIDSTTRPEGTGAPPAAGSSTARPATPGATSGQPGPKPGEGAPPTKTPATKTGKRSDPFGNFN